VRNRVRRLLREGVRRAIPHLMSGYDMVFIARNEIVEQPYNRIEAALESLFKRANLWREEPNS
jgi:ribonuclease P protein component